MYVDISTIYVHSTMSFACFIFFCTEGMTDCFTAIYIVYSLPEKVGRQPPADVLGF